MPVSSTGRRSPPAAVDPRHTDGIGLTRTEFLFRGSELPDEARQYRAYTEILEWGAGPPGGERTPAGAAP